MLKMGMISPWDLLVLACILLAFSVWFVGYPPGRMGRVIWMIAVPLILVNGASAISRYPGLLLCVVGGFCNWAVVLVNDGMPVVTHRKLPKDRPLHHNASENDLFPVLWDRYRGFSIGDILIALGVVAIPIGRLVF
jgi:hypothetical protein